MKILSSFFSCIGIKIYNVIAVMSLTSRDIQEPPVKEQTCNPDKWHLDQDMSQESSFFMRLNKKLFSFCISVNSIWILDIMSAKENVFKKHYTFRNFSLLHSRNKLKNFPSLSIKLLNETISCSRCCIVKSLFNETAHALKTRQWAAKQACIKLHRYTYGPASQLLLRVHKGLVI